MSVLPKSDWLEEYSLEDTLQILRDLAWSHIKEAGPYRDILGNFLRNSDWVGLCNYKLPYEDESDPVHLQHARQALGFFQKLEVLPLGLDKELAGLRKFVETERACANTNAFLRDVRKGRACNLPFVDSVIYTAQRKIVRVLGELPLWSTLDIGFGPGATTTTKRRFANWATKLNSDLECSANLAPWLNGLGEEVPHWFFLHAHACNSEKAWVDVRVAPGRLTFVPKSAGIYRGIIVEPVLNTFFQRGLGRYLRGRLKRFGVDLDDQSRNQLLARAGSLAGSLATIDLSSASDTISRELVYELLPLDWARRFESCRTTTVTYKGTPYSLEKFSSMGNGFTFELETLIFWALSWAVLELEGLPTGWLAVYGDDIVLPTEAVPKLTTVFRACGFTINSEKSYSSGPFRESCGKDYFKGIDIRPYYQKSSITGESLFVLHNHYMRSFDFARAKKVRRYIHPALYIFGPDGYGDGHLIGSWRPIFRKKDRQRGWEGAYFETFSRESRRLKRVPETDWALPTYCIYARQGAETEYDPRVLSGSEGYKRTLIYTPRKGVFT